MPHEALPILMPVTFASNAIPLLVLEVPLPPEVLGQAPDVHLLKLKHDMVTPGVEPLYVRCVPIKLKFCCSFRQLVFLDVEVVDFAIHFRHFSELAVSGRERFGVLTRRVFGLHSDIGENLVHLVDLGGSTLFVSKDHLVVRGLGCGSFLEADGPSFWKVHVDNFDGILVSILEFKLSGTELLGAFRVLSDRRVDWL
jgi:hypothetical protein